MKVAVVQSSIKETEFSRKNSVAYKILGFLWSKQAIAPTLPIHLCNGIGYITRDLCIKLLADEEKHHSEFIGFLKEYEKV